MLGNKELDSFSEENDLANFIKEVVSEPEEDEAKEKYNKDMIREKKIIANSIKDHLIPQVSSKDTPKEMFDALTRMYEGRNINWKMNLIPTQKYKDEHMRIYPRIFHNGFPIQRTTRSN